MGEEEEVKKWRLDCLPEEEGKIYCTIFRDKEDVGFLSGLKDGTMTIELLSFRTMINGEFETYAKRGKPLAISKMFTAYTLPTKEIREKIRRTMEEMKPKKPIITIKETIEEV